MSVYGISNANTYPISDYYNNYQVGSPSANAKEVEKASGIGASSTPGECQTCKERKYVDGSNENVSFKAATHVSPDVAPSAVRAHEGEHVANAYDKATQGNGKVLSASVSIHTSICPECGRSYVSGGTTKTMISYPNEENPYQQNKKSLDALKLKGQNVDYVA